MKDMISRWLDVAKLQTGSYEIHPEFCLIKPMIRKALKHFSGFKDFECSLEISPDAAAATWTNRHLCRSFRIFSRMPINTGKRAVPAE